MTSIVTAYEQFFFKQSHKVRYAYRLAMIGMLELNVLTCPFWYFGVRESLMTEDKVVAGDTFAPVYTQDESGDTQVLSVCHPSHVLYSKRKVNDVVCAVTTEKRICSKWMCLELMWEARRCFEHDLNYRGKEIYNPWFNIKMWTGEQGEVINDEDTLMEDSEKVAVKEEGEEEEEEEEEDVYDGPWMRIECTASKKPGKSVQFLIKEKFIRHKFEDPFTIETQE